MPPKGKSKRKQTQTKPEPKEDNSAENVRFTTPSLMKYYRETVENEEHISKVNEAEINVKYLRSQRKVLKEELLRLIEDDKEHFEEVSSQQNENIVTMMESAAEAGKMQLEVISAVSSEYENYEKRFVEEVLGVDKNIESSLNTLVKHFSEIKSRIREQYTSLMEIEIMEFENKEQSHREKLSEITQMHTGNLEDIREESTEEITYITARAKSHTDDLRSLLNTIRAEFSIDQKTDEQYKKLVLLVKKRESRCQSLSARIEKLKTQYDQRKELLHVNKEEWISTNSSVRDEKKSVENHYADLNKEYQAFVKRLSAITSELSRVTQKTLDTLIELMERGNKILSIAKTVEAMEPATEQIGTRNGRYRHVQTGWSGASDAENKIVAQFGHLEYMRGILSRIAVITQENRQVKQQTNEIKVNNQKLQQRISKTNKIGAKLTEINIR